MASLDDIQSISIASVVWIKDPQLEKQLARDLLFRHFVGISLSQSVPDHSTLWRFRNKPEVQALHVLFLEEVNQQLSVSKAERSAL